MTLKKLITEKKRLAFSDGYEATDEEALGLLISQYFEWDGISILKTLGYALEDANFHSEHSKVNEMIAEINAKFKKMKEVKGNGCDGEKS